MRPGQDAPVRAPGQDAAGSRDARRRLGFELGLGVLEIIACGPLIGHGVARVDVD